MVWFSCAKCITSKDQLAATLCSRAAIPHVISGVIVSIVIDVISDVVCPWCFIGKRNLEAALALYRERSPDAEAPVINWHPFQLNPQLPKSGMPRSEYIAQKFGGPDRAKQIYGRVSAAGKQAGIDFDFDQIKIQPNTTDAHRLIYRAAATGKQDAMVEALFRAYFLEAKDLTQSEVLARLAAATGMDAEVATQYLASDEDLDLLANIEWQARQIGVEGVPFFIINRKQALSGAQPPAVLLQAIESVVDEAAAPVQ
jgi:predicted DsbA family dithiol-disulfide isomerase